MIYPRSIYNLPENLAEIVTEPINTSDNKWNDFNRLHRLWQILSDNSGLNKIISLNDLPPEPKVSDYPDMDD